MQIFTCLSVAPNPKSQSYPELYSRPPAVASLTYPTLSPVDHTDLPLQSSFPQLLLYPATQLKQAFPENSEVTPVREAGRLTEDLPISLPPSKPISLQTYSSSVAGHLLWLPFLLYPQLLRGPWHLPPASSTPHPFAFNSHKHPRGTCGSQ